MVLIKLDKSMGEDTAVSHSHLQNSLFPPEPAKQSVLAIAVLVHGINTSDVRLIQ